MLNAFKTPNTFFLGSVFPMKKIKESGSLYFFLVSAKRLGSNTRLKLLPAALYMV
jgi:hypothetical protein